MGNSHKKAKFAANVASSKSPRGAEPNASLGAKTTRVSDPEIEGRPLAWRFSSADGDGPFTWRALSCPSKYRSVVERLHEFETKRWEEIVGAGCHTIERQQLCKEAQDRLKAIERDDIDDLMSFRIAGAERVWAIRRQNIMHILWWDPTHKVYPTEKDKADRVKRKKRR